MLVGGLTGEVGSATFYGIDKATQAADGTVVISKNNGVIKRKYRQKAKEIFGADVLLLKEEGLIIIMQ